MLDLFAIWGFVERWYCLWYGNVQAVAGGFFGYFSRKYSNTLYDDTFDKGHRYWACSQSIICNAWSWLSFSRWFRTGWNVGLLIDCQLMTLKAKYPKAKKPIDIQITITKDNCNPMTMAFGLLNTWEHESLTRNLLIEWWHCNWWNIQQTWGVWCLSNPRT